MLASPLLDALNRLRFAPRESRPLEAPEEAQLRTQGNLFRPGCTVLAGPGFDAGTVYGNRFSGRVVLDGEVYGSVLEDTEIGPGTVVDQCPLVRRTLVGPGVLLRHSTLDCSTPTAY